MNKPIDITGVELFTARLYLREWRESDLKDFYEYASVEGVGEMAGWRHHGSIEESKAILDKFIAHKKTFCIDLDGKAIGSVGVEEYDEALFPEFAEKSGRKIGYVLSKEHWGQGLMPEAVAAVIQYLFEMEELDFLNCGHFEFNTRSKRVIEKCGFEFVKNAEFKTVSGTSAPTREYILTREKYISMIEDAAYYA